MTTDHGPSREALCVRAEVLIAVIRESVPGSDAWSRRVDALANVVAQLGGGAPVAEHEPEPPKPRTRDPERYAPVVRLAQTRDLLRNGGATVYDIAAEIGISTRTAKRYILALEQMNEPVWSEMDGPRMRYFIGYDSHDMLDRALASHGVDGKPAVRS